MSVGHFNFSHISHHPIVIDEKEYIVYDGNEFLDAYFYFPDLPEKDWLLKTSIIVGAMGIGKTTVGHNISRIQQSRYKKRYQGVITNHMEYALTEIKWKGFMCDLFYDDAVTQGLDSRRSSSDDNVNATEAFFMTRHVLETASKRQNLPPVGVMHLMLATQAYMAIDVRIRKNAAVTILKSWDEDYRKWLPKEEQQFLQDISDDALCFNKNSAKRLALGKTIGGKFIHFEFEDFKNSSMKYCPKPDNYIGPTQRANIKAINSIRALIRNIDLQEIDSKVLKGMIYSKIDFTGTHLKDKDINKAIFCEIYDQYQRQSIANPDDLSLKMKKRLITRMRTEEITFQAIANVLDTNLSEVYRIHKKKKITDDDSLENED